MHTIEFRADFGAGVCQAFARLKDDKLQTTFPCPDEAWVDFHPSQVCSGGVRLEKVLRAKLIQAEKRPRHK